MDKTQQQRAKLVAGALALTHDTPLAPSAYERYLLAEFVRGALTIDQVLHQLATTSTDVDQPQASYS